MFGFGEKVRIKIVIQKAFTS